MPDDNESACQILSLLAFGQETIGLRWKEELLHCRAIALCFRKEREFKVSIKFASKADLYHLKEFLQGRQVDNPHETIQCLDVVLRSKPSNSYEAVGRSFFHRNFGLGKLDDGLDYWKGFY